jgi:hypothetical protein
MSRSGDKVQVWKDGRGWWRVYVPGHPFEIGHSSHRLAMRDAWLRATQLVMRSPLPR